LDSVGQPKRGNRQQRWKKRILRLQAGLLLITGFLLASGSAAGEELASGADKALQPLRTLLQQPEGQIDFAQAKLTIDRLIDPATSESATAPRLNALADRIRARFPVGATRRDKLNILISSLYQAGAWNDQRPFRYDLDDPLGANLRTKLLATYLSTRKGNCISMPILALILGQKLGLPVTLATAPQHVMVKYLDDNGQWLNVEATGGGFKHDSSYIRDTGISEKALRNDIYLRPLSQRESVAVMASTLMEFYGREGQYERQLEVTDLALGVNPKDVVAMAHKGAANYLLLRDRFMKPYPDPSRIPKDRIPEFQHLSQENLRWYDRAEKLGWAAPTPAQETKYLESIRHEKSVQGVR
jgi:regulator of sirC expression with transglutaminase-like and TPR domain